MNDCYDGLVLGSGHHALVLEGYLARCGLRVLSLDRAETPGGGLATVENPRLPGFFHNTHSFFHRAVTAMPWYRDLELARHGALYVEPDLNVALILRDGRSLQWWTDPEKTIESFAQFSANDARTLRRWIDEFRPIVHQILIPEAQSPPLPTDRRRELLQRSALGRRLLEVSALSPLEFVQREFENDVVRAGLLFFNGLREVDLRLKGFGHSIPALLAGPHMAQMCIGGSRRLAEALVEDVTEHGGEVRTGVELTSIVVEHGKVVGVELSDGERIGIEADGFIASGLNPQQTFLELMDAHAVPADLREKASQFRYNLLAPLLALNVALEQPPQYAAAEQCPELDRAFMVLLGLDRFEQFSQIVAAHERGDIPPTVMWGACPTLFDPTQAPPGKHTAFMWEKLPYAVRPPSPPASRGVQPPGSRGEGSGVRALPDASHWDALADEHANHMLSTWSEYAPNLAEGKVLDRFARSPLDTERSLPNMRYGDLLVGSFAGGQVGYHRPFPGAGRYRTPVRGLYLCGSATHPGGNITGLCGYNAAAVIAADLGLKPWWEPANIEEALASV